MAAKLPKGIDLDRLCQAVQTARRHLEYPRRERAASVREAAGNHHSEGGTGYPVPLNVIDMYERTVGRFLFGKNPRFMLTAADPRQAPAVLAMEKWVNDEVVRMNLADTLKRVGIDALHLFGVAKVGLADPGDAERRGWRLSAGVPFCDLVDPDDFVADPFARTPDEFSFVGHRFRTTVAAARSVYGRGKGDIQSQDQSDFNAQGDERIGVIGRGVARQLGEWEDRLDLWEVYLPGHRVVLTLLDDAQRGQPNPADPLRVARWVGHPDGPYAILGLGTVSGHWMPKGPVQNLMDLHLPLNRQTRKLVRQADRVKSVMPMRGDTKDYDRLVTTNDGFGFACDDPERLKELVVGGPVPSLHVFTQYLHQMLNEFAGNLPVLAGLGPQSKTAAQDTIINQNSSRGVADMQEDALDFVTSVGTRLCHLWWHHPQKVMSARYAPRSAPEFGRTLKVFPATAPRADAMGRPRRLRTGPMPEVRVDPYSLVHKTPQQRWAFVKQLVADLMPLTPLLQQAGIAFDPHAYLKLARKYNDEPDVETLYTFRDPPAAAEGGASPDRMPLPGGDKTTTIERRSMGDSSGQKRKADVMAEVMAGAGAAGEGQGQ